MTTKARRMAGLGIDEMSGVDHPAHGVEGWLVMKSAGGRTLLDKAQAAGTTTTEDPMPETKIDKSKLDEATRAYLEQVETERDEAVAKAAAAPAPTETSEEDEVTKALAELPETVRKAVESQMETVRKQAEDATAAATAAGERAAAEADKREEAESVAKARDAFKHVPVPESIGKSVDDLGRFMHRLAKAEGALPEDIAKSVHGPAPEGDEAEGAPLAKQVEDLLKAVNGQLESAKLFGELGSGLGNTDLGAGEATGKVEQLAKAAREADPNLTQEQAVAKALRENPDLYRTYRAEQG